MVKTCVLPLALSAAIITTALPASANPVTVGSGSVQVGGFALGSFRNIDFSLTTTDGSSVIGQQLDFRVGSVPSCSQLAPCSAGATTSPTNSYAISGSIGSATIGGTSYPLVLYSGNDTFNFTAGSVVLPVTTANVIDLTSPFTFNGVASIWTRESDSWQFLEDLALVGQGTATTHLQQFGSGYAVSGFTYQFTDATVSPTPEPASLLLFGSGAAFVLRRIRQRIA